MKKTTILGAGSFGSALALLLNRNKSPVTLWGHQEKTVNELLKKRRHANLPRNISLPQKIKITSDLKRAVASADQLILAVPTQAVRTLADQIKDDVNLNTPLISVAKGLELKTSLRNSEVLQEVFGPKQPTLVLSGPSHAEEIVERRPASVTLACKNLKLAKQLSSLFHNNRFRVYFSSDVTGVEIGGAIKNIIAIAAGICDGLQLGDNAKAALITRGLVEIKRYGTREGADPKTFDGLSGLGDLITTCFSPYGRNRAVGEALGQGKTLASILKSLNQVAEGVPTTSAVMKRARQLKIDMPICQQVEAILKGRSSAKNALEKLMSRSAKSENL